LPIRKWWPAVAAVVGVAFIVGAIVVPGSSDDRTASRTPDRRTTAGTITRSSPSTTRYTATTTKRPAATTPAHSSVTRPRRGCSKAPATFVRLVRSGLAFPGAGKLETPWLVRSRGGYYLAARIVPPDRTRPVTGIAVWAARSISANAQVVAVNKTAAAYSDWRRADTPLSAPARASVALARGCLD
jgi:hypothetical protein